MATPARREQLLDTALEIIARDGYGAISIDAIARRTGVTRPVVYRVFDDVNALLFALLDREERRALDRLLATISLEPDFDDFEASLSTTIGGLLSMVAEDPHTWRAILLAHEGTPAAVRKRIDRDRELVRERIQGIVDVALAHRPAIPGFDSFVLSHMLIAIAEHFGRIALDTPEAVDPDRLTATLLALLP